MKKLKRFILKYFPVHKFRYNCSYSQEGEDGVLLRCFKALKNYKGTYVDVDVLHPSRFLKIRVKGFDLKVLESNNLDKYRP